MKTNYYLARLLLAVIVDIQVNVTCHGQILLNENFDFLPGTALTANGWNSHSSAGVNPVTVASSGLTFQSYPSSDIGMAALLANTGEDVNKLFPSVTAGKLFCGFLVKVNSFENDYFLHLTGTPVGNNYKGRVFTNGTGNSFNFGLSKGAGTPLFTSSPSYSTASVYLIILKYSIVEGASNDEISLYIIEGSIPSAEPAVPTIGPVTDATQSDLSNLSGVALRQYSSNENIIIDGIRVATRWEDIVSGVTSAPQSDDRHKPVIFPVPARDEIIIRNIGINSAVEIFNLSGIKVISINSVKEGFVRIPVMNLKCGTYLVTIRNSDGVSVLRFIKY
jgi:hypothetical protein